MLLDLFTFFVSVETKNRETVGRDGLTAEINSAYRPRRIYFNFVHIFRLFHKRKIVRLLVGSSLRAK